MKQRQIPLSNLAVAWMLSLSVVTAAMYVFVAYASP
jgi:hypothetical protein